jgi:hypothetical protein
MHPVLVEKSKFKSRFGADPGPDLALETWSLKNGEELVVVSTARTYGYVGSSSVAHVVA